MTDFSQYRWYRCHVCHEPCINHVDEPRTQDTECADCYAIPALEQAPELGSDDRQVQSAE